MKQTLSVIFAFCVLAGAAYGENISVPGVGVFSNYVVRRVEPDGITIKQSAGVTKLFFSELPSDIRSRYAVDPVRAAEYQREKAIAQADWAEKVEQAKAKEQAEWIEHGARLQANKPLPNDEGGGRGKTTTNDDLGWEYSLGDNMGADFYRFKPTTTDGSEYDLPSKSDEFPVRRLGPYGRRLGVINRSRGAHIVKSSAQYGSVQQDMQEQNTRRQQYEMDRMRSEINQLKNDQGIW